MARDDDDTPWYRQLVVTAGVLLVVALLIGAVVGVVAVGAVKVTGLGSTTSTATASPSLYVPSGKPTTGVEGYPDPSTGATSASPSPSPSRKPRPKHPISLQALPRTVAPGERINLTGAYPRHEGAQLRVQRREGGRWTDFPVTARVSGGTFSTYITTSRTGVNVLRVAAGGATSNTVRVTVR